MYILSLLFITSFFIHSSLSAVAIELADPSIRHSGHCYERSSQIGSMEKGEIIQMEGECSIVECLESKDVSYESCGAVDAEEPCYIQDYDYSKDYPDCCKQIVCP